MNASLRLLQRALAPSPEKLVAVGGLLVVVTLYLDISPNNPPHFYRDESAIAYNAYTLETTGKDEYGARFPLFIKSFGDYKSPLYVYMLAGVFRITGPSIRVARDFSAVIGLATVFVLYALAYLITRRISLALATALLAGLSPYLFEISRLVFEVALEPVLIAVFLLVLYRAGRGPWRRRESVALAVVLALQAYDYQAGRVFAPAFFLGVLLFYRRVGARRLIELTIAFGILLIPLIVYTQIHPGALQHRLVTLTWYRSRMSTGTVVWQFLRHYLDDLNPWTWAVTGDVEPRDHVQGDGSLFFTEIGLAIAGAAIALRQRRDPWWRFLVFSVLVSPVAAATTFGGIQTLREITIPVLLPLLAIPAMQAIVEIPRRRLRAATVGALAIALAVETFHWQVVFRHNGPKRLYDFEAPIQPVIDAAFKHGGTVYAYRSNHATYIDSLWFGALDKRSPSSIVVLDNGAPPPGSLVIGSNGECPSCKVLIADGEFEAYITLR